MPSGDAPELSPREREILGLLATGLRDREVAERLGVGVGTVREYRMRAERKLRARGLAQCLLVAWRLGLIDLAPLADAAMERRTPPTRVSRARTRRRSPDAPDA